MKKPLREEILCEGVFSAAAKGRGGEGAKEENEADTGFCAAVFKKDGGRLKDGI